MFRLKDTLRSGTVSLALNPEGLMPQRSKAKTAENSQKELPLTFSLNINQDFPISERLWGCAMHELELRKEMDSPIAEF